MANSYDQNRGAQQPTTGCLGLAECGHLVVNEAGVVESVEVVAGEWETSSAAESASLASGFHVEENAIHVLILRMRLSGQTDAYCADPA